MMTCPGLCLNTFKYLKVKLIKAPTLQKSWCFYDYSGFFIVLLKFLIFMKLSDKNTRKGLFSP